MKTLPFFAKHSEAAWEYSRRDHTDHHSSDDSAQKKTFDFFLSPGQYTYTPGTSELIYSDLRQNGEKVKGATMVIPKNSLVLSALGGYVFSNIFCLTVPKDTVGGSFYV